MILTQAAGQRGSSPAKRVVERKIKNITASSFLIVSVILNSKNFRIFSPLPPR